MEPWLVASLVVNINVKQIVILRKGSVANVCSEFGCENEY